ncbi:DEAD-box ATP-dependent RNA helicase 1 [Dorcoceras hygrometricum]|uniref:DEAD-box ATP-dependent RNA helicase 1 n=1 Tax=Dorcoceras hygrometricum TaxID=472368 RepID=A0A2Z7B8E7_9LAMI|nr:DEAD-box ATP-dependent RNA helicase 1 [Dorcoceras hygrometricum]
MLIRRRDNNSAVRAISRCKHSSVASIQPLYSNQLHFLETYQQIHRLLLKVLFLRLILFIAAGVSLATGTVHYSWFLLAEPLGSLAFKMVQVRQLENEQKVKLESASGWCVFVKASVFRVSS